MTNIFERLEDPHRPLLGPNYWMMKLIGLLLPKSKIKRYIYIAIHEIAALFVLSQYLELYIIRSNLDLIITNVKISMLSVVCVVKSNYSIFWQDKWIELLNYVTNVDKEDRDTYKDPRAASIIKQYTQYSRSITRFYWILLLMTSLTVTTTPLLKYVTSPTYKNNLKIGIEPFTHIFSSWMPFDKYNFPGSWITVIWHVIICAYGATIIMAYDVMAIVLMVFFGGKLDLIRLKCTSLFHNVNQSDKQFYGLLKQLHREHTLIVHPLTSTAGHKLLSMISTMMPITCIPVDIPQSWIYSYSKLLNSMLSPVMFLYVVMCSLMLCASAFQLTSAKDTTEKILMAQYLSFGVSQLFMFCWHSNHVFYKSNNVMTGPYESQWWSQDALKQKNVLLLMGKLKKTIIFTAGPYTDLTLGTFINILKGAYSYYTLLHKDD